MALHLTPEQEDQFNSGKLLPLMEDFYSIQGEGHNTGKPAYFIRLGGCDMGCWWCDVKESWDASIHPLTETDEIVKRAVSYPAKAAVITGGEPALYELGYLTGELKRRGISTFIETAGVRKLTGSWDWICLSPKKGAMPHASYYETADELKVIISSHSDLAWAELNAGRVHDRCLLYLQPEWSRSDEMLPLIIDYVKTNPKWNISLQAHKYMNIP